MTAGRAIHNLLHVENERDLYSPERVAALIARMRRGAPITLAIAVLYTLFALGFSVLVHADWYEVLAIALLACVPNSFAVARMIQLRAVGTSYERQRALIQRNLQRAIPIGKAYLWCSPPLVALVWTALALRPPHQRVGTYVVGMLAATGFLAWGWVKTHRVMRVLERRRSITPGTRPLEPK